MSDYISREAVLALVDEYTGDFSYLDTETAGFKKDINAIPAADVREIPEGGVGELSDGYHTFNALYRQRMVLFAALVKQNRARAWKSFRHEDGEFCFGGGWFIVGIDTPEGSYTYHYENKDFDLFDCVELPVAPHWDGHTEADVTRLLSLPDVRENRWISVKERLPEKSLAFYLCYTDAGIIVECLWTNNKYGLGPFGEWGWRIMDVPQHQSVTHWMPLPEPPKEDNA